MNIEEYIDRIGYDGNISCDINCLKSLHRKHVMTIPFEALDVQLKRKIDLNLERIYKKVIIDKRGGYCYELNFLFHSFLTSIGFKSSLISARIFDDGSYGPEFDHMSIVVSLQDLWLVDVGYGDLFIEPIKIYPRIIQNDRFKKYKIENIDNVNFLLLESLKDMTDFQSRYMFDLKSREIGDFEEQNHIKQFSSESYFVKNRICTLATKDGRKTVLNDVFKVKTGDQVHKRIIKGENDFVYLLASEFNIKID